MTHPTPETLLPYALGADDAATARHVEGCVVCRGEIDRLREAAHLLRSATSLDPRVATPDCLDELTIADFVEGRLGPDARAPVVAHLLTCARCRSVVQATGRILAETATKAPDRGLRRWYWPLGVAAAAALLVLLWPRSANDTGSTAGLRESATADTTAPVPIAPRASVVRVDRFVWSRVPLVARYRLRLYDAEGSLLWAVETADTAVMRPDSVALLPRIAYYWKAEAEIEWQRWATSDLVQFQLTGVGR